MNLQRVGKTVNIMMLCQWNYFKLIRIKPSRVGVKLFKIKFKFKFELEATNDKILVSQPEELHFFENDNLFQVYLAKWDKLAARDACQLGTNKFFIALYILLLLLSSFQVSYNLLWLLDGSINLATNFAGHLASWWRWKVHWCMIVLCTCCFVVWKLTNSLLQAS